MTEDAARYARVQEVLLGARHLSDDFLRAYLDRECADDASLRARVLELLDAGTDEGTRDLFAEERVEQFRSRLESFFGETKNDWLPEEIGPYQVIRKIGQGGMGVVYEAEQPSPRRRVAIKLLHPMHATVDRLRRLTQEAELLGRLQHPGIAQIYEASTFDFGYGPQPYFAMELIDGVDLRTYCERQKLDTDARVALLAQVADAIHSAHERGVIHRDLKPENILVDESGQPKVLDFGIAQTTEAATQMSTMGTQEGQLIGTLAYMAPEQLSPSEGEIKPLVDVFALGVTGFELLTGRLPREVEGLSISQAVARLVTTDAPRASTIRPALSGDIETVLGKALDPEADRRYRTAAAFAADLRRILAHEPIEARPPTRRYLAGKFVRRNRTLVGGTFATIVALVIGTVISLVMASVARSQRDLANEREHFANNGILQSAQYLVEAGRDREAERQLRLIPEEERGIAWQLLHRQVPQSLDLATAQMEFLGEDHLIGVNRTRQGLTVYSILDETSELRFPELEIHAIFEVVGTRFIVVEGAKESCLLLDLEAGQLIERQPLEIATGTLEGTGQGFRQKRGLECDETGAIVLSHPDSQTAVIRQGEETWLTVSDLQFDESVHLGARGEIAVLNRREEILVVDLPGGAPRLRIAIPAGEIAKGSSGSRGAPLLRRPAPQLCVA